MVDLVGDQARHAQVVALPDSAAVELGALHFDVECAGDVLEQWLTEGARMSVRASTFRSYSDIVRLHLVPELGHVRLAKLQPQHVERLLNGKLEEGLSPRRVQYIHAVLRRAVRWGVLARNVATLVDVPRVVRPEVQPLTPDEIATFLQAVSGDRVEALYLLAVSTGLRQGELLALRWEDVDLEAGILHVRRSLQRVSGELRYEEPKSLRSRRVVPLAASVVAALRAHADRQDREQRRARGAWEETGLVFTTAQGRPLDGTNVTHRF